MIDKMRIVLDEGAFKPLRAHDLDAGYDLRTPIDFVLCGTESKIIDTGVHVEIPAGYVGILKSKSGLNAKASIIGTGTLDAGYTGSIKVVLHKLEKGVSIFQRGDKIIQLVIFPIETPELEVVDRLDDTERGANGFGSTGK